MVVLRMKFVLIICKIKHNYMNFIKTKKHKMKIKELNLICRTSNEWIMLIEVKQYFKLPYFISCTFCRRKHIRPWIIYGNKDTEVVILLGQLLIYIMAIGLGEVCLYNNKMAHCEFKNQYTKTKF